MTLLTGGSLSPAVSLSKLSGKGLDLNAVLALVCRNLHVQVIERAGNSASLYGSVGTGHICILIKGIDGSYSIDAKGTEATLVASVMDEVKLLLS